MNPFAFNDVIETELVNVDLFHSAYVPEPAVTVVKSSSDATNDTSILDEYKFPPPVTVIGTSTIEPVVPETDAAVIVNPLLLLMAK